MLKTWLGLIPGSTSLRCFILNCLLDILQGFYIPSVQTGTRRFTLPFPLLRIMPPYPPIRQAHESSFPYTLCIQGVSTLAGTTLNLSDPCPSAVPSFGLAPADHLVSSLSHPLSSIPREAGEILLNHRHERIPSKLFNTVYNLVCVWPLKISLVSSPAAPLHLRPYVPGV